MKPGNLEGFCLFLFLAFLITASDAGKKKSKEKIIIHVPYKIHKHHHTHTKYKVITVPAPKKEHTIIYLTEEKQPEVKLPPVEYSEMVKTFIPPHQESAKELLQAFEKHKTKDSAIKGQEAPSALHQESSKQQTEGEDFVKHSYSLDHFHPHYFPVSYQPIMLQHQSAFIPKYSYYPMMPPAHEDNIPHSTDHYYKTIIAPKTKTPSYQVKEEPKEVPKPRQVTRRPKSHNLGHINVPSLTKFPHPYNSLSNEEYEHVGYLIIDGNSRKVVGKNFKDEIKLYR